MITLLQTPAPLPPQIVPDAFLIGRVQELAMMVLVLIFGTVIAIKVLGPLARALARRLEGRVGDSELRGDIEHLREQLGEMDGLRGRVQELEERLEFTERLLTQRRDQDLLERGGRR